MSKRHVLAAGIVASSTLVAFAVPAFAHVATDPSSVEAGASARVGFRIPHGCEGAPTDTVEIQIPEGVISVKPQFKAGWTVEVEQVDTAPYELWGKTLTTRVGVVRWSGGSLPDNQFDDFAISAKMPDAAGTTLAFPVVQKCGTAQNAWVEPMNADGSEPEHPAPTLEIVAATTDEHDHDHAAATETTVAGETVTTEATTETTVAAADGAGDASAIEARVTALEDEDGGSSSNGLGIVAIVLGGLALIVGVVGLTKKR